MTARVVDIHAHALIPPARADLTKSDRERIRGINALEMLTVTPPP